MLRPMERKLVGVGLLGVVLLLLLVARLVLWDTYPVWFLRAVVRGDATFDDYRGGN